MFTFFEGRQQRASTSQIAARRGRKQASIIRAPPTCEGGVCDYSPRTQREANNVKAYANQAPVMNGNVPSPTFSPDRQESSPRATKIRGLGRWERLGHESSWKGKTKVLLGLGEQEYLSKGRVIKKGSLHYVDEEIPPYMPGNAILD
jgi:hypothetical protein